MNRLLTIATALTAFACQRSEGSRPFALYGDLDLRLVGSAQYEADPWASAVGAMVYGSPDTIAFLENTSDCTGFAISPELILTAGHCQQAEPFAYVFNPLKLAKDPEAQVLEIEISRSVRLKPLQELIPAAAEAIEKPAWISLVYRDNLRDFSIYRHPQKNLSRYIDLFDSGSASGDLALYAFPQSLPLTVAGPCQGQIGSSARDVWHDCDSLGGSSGGLLVNQSEQKPLGLHHFGGGDNFGSYYSEQGRFELPEDMLARKKEFWTQKATPQDWQRAQDFWNCPPPAHAEAEACVLAGGLNRALLLSEVLDRLKGEAPELYNELAEGTQIPH